MDTVNRYNAERARSLVEKNFPTFLLSNQEVFSRYNADPDQVFVPDIPWVQDTDIDRTGKHVFNGETNDDPISTNESEQTNDPEELFYFHGSYEFQVESVNVRMWAHHVASNIDTVYTLDNIERFEERLTDYFESLGADIPSNWDIPPIEVDDVNPTRMNYPPEFKHASEITPEFVLWLAEQS